MNLLRKSSMILLGAATAGLLAFACAGSQSDGSADDSADLTVPNHVLISQIYARGGVDAPLLDGDMIELFNPTDGDVPLKGMSLQLANADEDFKGDVKIDLPDATIAKGKYFVISLTPNATLKGVGDAGSIALTPDWSVPAKGDGSAQYTLYPQGMSIALVHTDSPLGVAPSDPDAGAAKAISLVGYGQIHINVGADAGWAVATAEGKALDSLSGSLGAVRKLQGCRQGTSNHADFDLAAPVARGADPVVCATLIGGGASGDAGPGKSDSSAPPATSADGSATVTPGSSGDASTGGTSSADASTSGTSPDASAPKPPKGKDAGPTDPGTGGTHGDTAGGSGGADNGADSTPPPTTGKKKTSASANTPPQPIAASSPSCSTTPGPVSTGSFAGLAGLGLAVASVVRRRRK